jgi:quercetin dioxygenase-like cupin family protein
MQLSANSANAIAPRRAQIERLEAVMRELPQLDVPTEHTYGPGFYARTIRIPAGATLTGKVHASEHIFMVSQGELLVVTDDGERHVVAPFQMVCRPGTKRAGHALTDVVCTNVHITNTRDLAQLEAELIEPEALPAPEQLEALA